VVVLVVDEAHHLKNESGGLHRSLARLTCNNADCSSPARRSRTTSTSYGLYSTFCSRSTSPPRTPLTRRSMWPATAWTPSGWRVLGSSSVTLCRSGPRRSSGCLASTRRSSHARSRLSRRAGISVCSPRIPPPHQCSLSHSSRLCHADAQDL